MQSIEHGRLFLFECFQGIDAFRQLDNPIANYNTAFMREMLKRQDPRKCTSLMATMAQTHTHWVPTLTTLKMSAMANDAEFVEDARLAYIPFIVRKLLWQPDISRAANRGFDVNGDFVHGEFFAAASSHAGQTQKAGIRLLTDTDNIDTYVFTGVSLHDELALLVDAALTSIAAIQTATINAAGFANRVNKPILCYSIATHC